MYSVHLVHLKGLSRREGVSAEQRGWRAKSAGPTRECCPHSQIGDEQAGLPDDASSVCSAVR